MKRFGIVLVAFGALAVLAGHAVAQDANQTSEGATFGFDTPTSPRPRSSLSYKAAASQTESSYSYSIPNYVPHKTSARARLAASAPYVYPFAGQIGYSVNGAEMGWGNSGTWVGHPQYLGYGYPFASGTYFGFGR